MASSNPKIASVENVEENTMEKKTDDVVSTNEQNNKTRNLICETIVLSSINGCPNKQRSLHRSVAIVHPVKGFVASLVLEY